METLLKYYGLDWLAMALSLLAVYLLGNKNRIGFVSFVTANTLWVYLGIALIGSYGIAVGNFVFLIMNVRGFLKWKS
jgi:hypothetical protein